MKLSRIGRAARALAASVAVGLGMTACGGGTVGFMWVTGINSTATTTSAIVGYKIDNFTGNLTTIPGSPFTSSGVNPGTLVVRAGGRYVYVVNQGTKDPVTQLSNRDGNISEYSVGGDGTLVFQENYATKAGTPVWAVAGSGGDVLYVLDNLAPDGSTYAANGQGDISVFSIAADTGRLSVVTNQQIKDANDQNITYFPVGQNPNMMRASGNSCLFVADKQRFGIDAQHLRVSVPDCGRRAADDDCDRQRLYQRDERLVDHQRKWRVSLPDRHGVTDPTGAPTTSGQIYALHRRHRLCPERGRQQPVRRMAMMAARRGTRCGR